MILSAGCPSTGTSLQEEVVLPPASLARGTAAVLPAESDVPVALGAVVRVTHDVAVVLAGLRGDASGPFRVRLPGDAPASAHVLGRVEGAIVLGVARSGRDVRPLELAPEPPSPLARTLFLPARSPRLAGPQPCSIAADPPRGRVRGPRVEWLAAVPQDEEGTASDPEGGLVLDRQGRLLGLVGPVDAGLPRLLVAASVFLELQEAILLPPGADLVRPEDVFLVYAVHVDALSDLPRLSDEEGSGPMVVLELRVGNALAGRIEVTQGRPRLDATVPARGVGPVSVQLVALDRNLAHGETRTELSEPASVFAVAARLDFSLLLKPEAVARYPGPPPTGRAVHARLTFEPVDPDRQSGLRRTPGAAAAMPLGRPTEGILDLMGGCASEFWTMSDSTAEPVVAVLFRRRLGSRFSLAIFQPGYEGDLVALEAGRRDGHVAIAGGRLLKGRTILRARQLSGADPVPYEVLVAPLADASGIVSPLFRLVNREAGKDDTAFMDSDAFAEDVSAALEKTRLPHEAMCRALLDELGGRVQVTRRLAFCLLEQHFVPGRALLEEAFATGGAGAQDAGLLLAELDPREPKVRPVVRRACGDPDPYVRARAVRSAARSGDPAWADEIADLCATDPAPIVERAVAAARLSALLLRQAGNK